MKEDKKQEHERDINDKMIIRLRDLSHIMRSLYEGKGSQKRVLIVLGKNGGRMTQRELTKELGIQPGSVSEVIAKLEGAGLVERCPNENDRRTASVSLTKTGGTLAEEAKAQRQQRHEEMFSCLTDSEKETLLTLLDKVGCDWEKRYGHLKITGRGKGEKEKRGGHWKHRT